MLNLSHCDKRSPKSNESDTTIDAIGKRWNFMVWLLWRLARALLLDWVPAWFFDGRFWWFGRFRSVRRFGSAVMTSSVPRVGRGGGGCAEVRLVLRLGNESITNVTEAWQKLPSTWPTITEQYVTLYCYQRNPKQKVCSGRRARNKLKRTVSVTTQHSLDGLRTTNLKNIG